MVEASGVPVEVMLELPLLTPAEREVAVALSIEAADPPPGRHRGTADRALVARGAVLLGWNLAIGIQGWADQHGSGGADPPEASRRGSWALLALCLTAAGGPVVIAVVAFAGRLVRTGTVYLALALLLGAFGIPFGEAAARDLVPPPPVPSGPGGCQEHSGGDTRCPGG